MKTFGPYNHQDRAVLTSRDSGSAAPEVWPGTHHEQLLEVWAEAVLEHGVHLVDHHVRNLEVKQVECE